MKKKNRRTGDCVVHNISCIKWNLDPIPCLGIETGDMMDEVTLAIVNKICSIAGTDLDTLNIQCLIDKLDVVDPTDRSLTTILQLLIDNDCKLADLITDVRNLINEQNTTLQLDLKCLATYDTFGNQLPYDEQSVLQSLITKACNIDGQIIGLTSSIAETNVRIDNLPAPYAEPSLITCLSGVPRPLSTTVELLASDYCTFKAKIGTIGEIDAAIGAEPIITDVTDPLFVDPDLIDNPSILAESELNQWIFIKSLLTRIKALEACACQVKCSDITIGFIVVFEDDDTVTLKFTSGAGTNIPTQFTDCGSILTISSSSGVVSAPIDLSTIDDGIAQNAELTGIDISLFEVGDMLTFDINVNLCADGQSCQKCVSRTVKNTSGCCTITATGEVTIVFQTCGLP